MDTPPPSQEPIQQTVTQTPSPLAPVPQGNGRGWVGVVFVFIIVALLGTYFAHVWPFSPGIQTEQQQAQQSIAPGTVECTPSSQDATAGQAVTFHASGGTGAYGWSDPDAQSIQQNGAAATVVYAREGTFTMTLQDSEGVHTTCSTLVLSSGPASGAPEAPTATLCSGKQETEIGGVVYPIADTYASLGYLGTYFTAEDCSPQRLEEVLGGQYPQPEAIQFKNPPGSDLITVLKQAGLAPSPEACAGTTESQCTSWRVLKQEDLIPRNLLKLRPFIDNIKSADCYYCG